MESDNTEKRKEYLDTIKFCSIFIIIVTHFIEMFRPEYFSFWSTMPAGLILYGVSGKLGVAVLGVLMCYFAMEAKEDHPLRYFFKRYAYFLAAGLFVNAVYYVFQIASTPFNLRYFLAVSVSLGDGIFSTFWCMRSFLAASCIAYLNGKYHVSAKIILLEILLLFLGIWDWTAICLLGSLAWNLLRNERISAIMSKWYVKVVLLFFVFIAIKRPEDQVTYYLDGLSAMIFLMVTECSRTMRAILNKPKGMKYLGKYTMTLFLLHPSIFHLIGTSLFSTKYFYPSLLVSFIVVFGISTLVLIPLSIVLQWALDAYNWGIAALVRRI